MNRRIKKKVEKRHSGLLFDPFTGIGVKPKTYRERKMNAKILHGFIVANNRSYYSEYDYRLKLRRSYRKGWEKAAIDKIINPKGKCSNHI